MKLGRAPATRWIAFCRVLMGRECAFAVTTVNYGRFSYGTVPTSRGFLLCSRRAVYRTERAGIASQSDAPEKRSEGPPKIADVTTIQVKLSLPRQQDSAGSGGLCAAKLTNLYENIWSLICHSLSPALTELDIDVLNYRSSSWAP